MDLEIAPGVVVTFDKMAVIRTEQEANGLERPASAGEAKPNEAHNPRDEEYPPFDDEGKH